MQLPVMSRSTRLAAHSAVSTSLALCSDRGLADLVDQARPLGSGIGGTSALLEIAGTPVFVKQVPLTELEVQPEVARSTANVFGLPTFCHYGIGGPGFGAWRELAAQTMTTNWVLAGECEGFPLMYHWRVLPSPLRALPEELADVERVVAYWGGGLEVRRRIEALQRSSSSVVLFLEYFPQNVHEWLGAQVAAGGEVAGRACAMVEEQLAAGVSFMNARGLLHFDAHFENILTDGHRLFFADYGLAISSQFDLAPDEAEFFDQHRSYDASYTVTYLVRWLATALYGFGEEGRSAFVRACARGQIPADVPERIASIFDRHAPIAAVLGDFHRDLQQQSRSTPYPLGAIRQTGHPDGAFLA
ncbi:protein kinase family protein [Streptomyces sp. NPDC001904]|uniref:protein kinase family protein n=1 Tax=Streptomyces sp. NPDC001904 TaxID=3154531 RepID=UPI0033251304